MFDKLKERQARRKEIADKLINQMESPEIVKQRIKSRENIAKKILERDNPCSKEKYIQSAIELSRDPNDINEPFGWKKGTVRGILTFWITIGFLLITMLMIFTLPLSLNIIFEMWKVLSLVFTIVIGSYFYTRIKMGNMFN